MSGLAVIDICIVFVTMYVQGMAVSTSCWMVAHSNFAIDRNYLFPLMICSVQGCAQIRQVGVTAIYIDDVRHVTDPVAVD